MSRFVRPVAVCVLALFGVSPLVALACEWSCSPAAAQHHHGGHEHAATPADSVPVAASDTAWTALTQSCDHVGSVVVAVTSASTKVVTPTVTTAVWAVFPRPSVESVASVNYSTHSPPGGPSRPLSLRI